MGHGSFYYPQAVLIMRLRLEDFGNKASGISNEWHNVVCLAKSVTVKINEYTRADEFKAEIDFRNFPFDPRAIRACAVTICMQDMGELYNESNALRRITPSAENVIFMGFADEEGISFNDSEQTVSLEGRDQTALLIDRKFVEGNVDLDKPLDKVIRILLDRLEEAKTLAVEARGLGELPVLSSFWSDKGALSGKKNVPKDRTYWDVIQSIVADAGLIAYVELDKLVITKPRVLYDRNQAKVFMWGRMIDDLEFSRKIGRKKGFNLAVRCLNIEAKEVLQALIPKEATEEWSNETGIANTEVKIPKMVVAKPADSKDAGKAQDNSISDKQAEEEGTAAPYMVYHVANVTSKKQLIEIGQGIYEEISRQQIEGSFKTREMKMRFKRLDGSFETFNLLKLRVGTPIVVEVSGDAVSDMKRSGDVEGINNILAKNRFDSRVAKTLAQSIGRANTPFYTKSVSFTLDSERGFEASIDFINFIETKVGR